MIRQLIKVMKPDCQVLVEENERPDVPTGGVVQDLPTVIQTIHEDIWNRFVLAEGLVLDYAGLDGSVDLPTPEDASLARPNAVSWWVPTENGAFHTGIYLQAMVQRARFTDLPGDKAKARRLANGLMRCASVGSVPGFIARYVLSDGRSHYAMGSDDQTGPWFAGLWSYIRSGIPTEEEKSSIAEKIVEVAAALKASQWRLPCDPIGDVKSGEFRGDLSVADFRAACRVLFVMRAVAELTNDPAWNDLYKTALSETPGGGTKSRLDYIAEGLAGDFRRIPMLSDQQLWIFANSQAMLAELIKLEENPEVRDVFRRAMLANADAVLPEIRNGRSQSALEGLTYDTHWRDLNEIWQPQVTSEDATRLATEQFELWNNQGRNIEIRDVREPLCASLIFFLSPDRPKESDEAGQALEKLIAGIRWNERFSSFGIFAEAAWYEMQDVIAGRSKT